MRSQRRRFDTSTLGCRATRVPFDNPDGESSMGGRLATYPGGSDEGGQGLCVGWRGREGQLDEERWQRELDGLRSDRRYLGVSTTRAARARVHRRSMIDRTSTIDGAHVIASYIQMSYNSQVQARCRAHQFQARHPPPALKCTAFGSSFSSLAKALSSLAITFNCSASMSVSSSSACLPKGLLGRSFV
jgi:hypothetical protein